MLGYGCHSSQIKGRKTSGNREGAKNSGGKRQAYYQSQVITGKRRSLSALVPVSLTTQVPDQQNFTGATPEWSDSQAPAQKGVYL